MPFVPVPKDLTKVKSKLVLGLTKRQLVCFGSAALVGIPAYLFTRGAIGNSAAVLFMIGLMLPFFFLAMYEKDGRPAEKILLNILRAKLWPGVRPYRTENLYKYLNEGGEPIANKGKTAGTAAGGQRQTGKSQPR
jgi:hypothetical protein